METKTFKYCGIEITVKEMSGAQQHDLTKGEGSKCGRILNVIRGVLVSVGNVTKFDDKFLNSLVEPFRKLILIKSREITTEGTKYAGSFVHEFEYKNEKGRKDIHKVNIDLTQGFPKKSIVVSNNGTLEDANYKEYSELDTTIVGTLPKAKVKVLIDMLDGLGEQAMENVKRKDRSTHLTLIGRNPRYLEEKTKTPIQINLNKAHPVDLAYMRDLIKEREGRIDTEYDFEHPENDGQFEVIDILGCIPFFYLSGTI